MYKNFVYRQDKMIIIIPLGGIGLRFKEHGYRRPKALIRVNGRPLLYYLLDNLNVDGIDFVSIPYNKEYAEYHFETQLKKDYPKINFLFYQLPCDTNGAAETINTAIKNFPPNTIDKPVLCLDGDNFYSVDIVKRWNGENKIIVFDDGNVKGSEQLYSYIQTNNEAAGVSDIAEKVRISSYACSGAYGFNSFRQLLEYSQHVIDNNTQIQHGEYYTSSVIREMIQGGGVSFTYSVINIEEYFCLGTPFQLRMFHENHKAHSKKLRICFDIDNTLVTFPQIENDYSSVQPIHKMISLLQRLKQLGHYIILYTARRMKTYKGNVGQAIADVAKITFETLAQYNIQYDEIHFGKPYADMYIDDLAINAFDNVEKEMGFYMDTIEPRKFNTVSIERDVVVKSSKSLEGEIYFYQQFPDELIHLFPKLLGIDSVHFKWLKIQKIDGLALTNLYLSELLTPLMLIKVMDSLNEIHSYPTPVDLSPYDIYYKNYCDKLSDRFHNYDYSCFPDSTSTFESIMFWLSNYTIKKICVIHGDAVMTNILVTPHKTVKFIDMRGQQGTHLSIYGDVLYDWAKLFQSLIGYDQILQERKVAHEYESTMIDTFKAYFLSKFSNDDYINMCWITKSLILSLIPLHDNDKCREYYKLISKIMV